MSDEAKCVMKISISGPAGAGKDYLADALRKNKLGYRFTRMALADPMKQIVADVLGVTVDEVNHRKLHDVKLRRALQILGTEMGRDCLGPNVWVNKLLRDVRKLEEESPGLGVIVTDCRFPNEFDALKLAGFLMVDVACPDEFHRLSGIESLHSSETALNAYRADGRFDVKVWNDRTIDDERLVRSILELVL